MNTYEMAARHKKVAALVDVLRKANVTADEALLADESSQRLAAVAAGVNHPSAETWKLVVETLREAK